MAFRFIPREEKFYQDFLAIADELKNGAKLLEEMLATRPAGVRQGRGDQGNRAQVRLPEPRGLPAPSPDVRHAARPRGHPRAGALARRRDGRRSTRRRATSACTRCEQVRYGARELARIISESHRGAAAGDGGPRGRARVSASTWSRSTGWRTKRTGCTWKPSAAVRGGEGPDPGLQVEGDPRPPRGRHRPLRGRRRRDRRRRSQERLRTGWTSSSSPP